MTHAAETPVVSPGGFAAGLRGLGPIGLVAVFVIIAGSMLGTPIAGALVVLWVWLSKTPWRDIGYERPISWPATIVFGVLFGVAFKVIMKAIVMRQLGAPDMNPNFQFLAGDPWAALEFAVVAVIIGAGFGEETVFRGWMFERLGKVFGHGAGAKVLIVLITAALFGLTHYFGQGWPGVEQAAIVGVVFGALYAATGRLFPIMIAHVAFDLTALWMIYFGYEKSFAHLVFP